MRILLIIAAVIALDCITANVTPQEKDYKEAGYHPHMVEILKGIDEVEKEYTTLMESYDRLANLYLDSLQDSFIPTRAIAAQNAMPMLGVIEALEPVVQGHNAYKFIKEYLLKYCKDMSVQEANDFFAGLIHLHKAFKHDWDDRGDEEVPDKDPSEKLGRR